ncbi:Fatty acid desaturase-like protein 2 [Elsinoe fawcettii]|nr:Fatty acid desaturase-like protein 2 [Elsinoe fawcettii]
MSTTTVLTEASPATIRVRGVAAEKQEIQTHPTLQQLRDAIPKDCFESSLPISLAYLARDLCYTAGLIYLALQIHHLPSAPLRFFAWCVYGFFQGCVGTGIWILAHECGHGAFSRYQKINSVIGWALHSLLLVPYFSWQITHARHHRNTGHIDRDPVFSPTKENELPDSHDHHPHDLWEDAPIVSTIQFFIQHVTGFQLYLLTNVTAGPKSGPPAHGGRPSGSHLNPYSDLFTADQRGLIAMSTLGLILTLSGLWFASYFIPGSTVVLLYFPPYAMVHLFIVSITYLHHTDPSTPYYSSSSWNFTKGALSTIDRDFGFIGRHFMHEIIDHHVVHHLFSRIPFYKAERATEAMRPLLGENYKERRDVSFFGELASNWGKCGFVREDSHGRWKWVVKN